MIFYTTIGQLALAAAAFYAAYWLGKEKASEQLASVAQTAAQAGADCAVFAEKHRLVQIADNELALAGIARDAQVRIAEARDVIHAYFAYCDGEATLADFEPADFFDGEAS